MTTLMLKEERSHLAQMNLIGEQCAQFRSGTLAMMREAGADAVIDIVERYHAQHPGRRRRGLASRTRSTRSSRPSGSSSTSTPSTTATWA